MSKLSDPEEPATYAADTIAPVAWKALWGSAVGYAMDGFDLLTLGFINIGRAVGGFVTWL
jgi:hypothetical protein